MYGHRKRILEKFLKNADNFSIVDLLELILCIAIPRKDTRKIAYDLKNKYISLQKILNADSQELLTFPGLGEKSVLILKILFELSLRIPKEKLYTSSILDNFEALINYCTLKIGHKKLEELHVLYMNNQNILINDEILCIGNINSVHIDSNEILHRCHVLGSRNIFITHNHPSGNPQPSKEDIMITDDINKKLQFNNIKLVDHIIVGGNNYFSFKEKGFI